MTTLQHAVDTGGFLSDKGLAHYNGPKITSRYWSCSEILRTSRLCIEYYKSDLHPYPGFHHREHDISAIKFVCGGELAAWPVIRYRRAFNDFLFAIPAFIILKLGLTRMVVAASLWIASSFSLMHMRQLLNQTFVGRLATTILHPKPCDPAEPMAKVGQRVGSTKLDLSFPIRQRDCSTKRYVNSTNP